MTKYEVKECTKIMKAITYEHDFFLVNSSYIKLIQQNISMYQSAAITGEKLEALTSSLSYQLLERQTRIGHISQSCRQPNKIDFLKEMYIDNVVT